MMTDETAKVFCPYCGMRMWKLQEAFALCPDELAVLDEWHPGLPGYAPPQECKSCKIDD